MTSVIGYTKAGADSKFATLAALSALTAGADPSLDTFLEAFNRFMADESAASALTTTVAQKAPKHGVIVAAVDAPAGWITAADYVCDGVNDDVEINAALTAAGAGGTIVLRGNFVIGAPIRYAADGQSIVGMSMWRGTHVSSSGTPVNSIKLANAANCNMIEVPGSGVVNGGYRKCYAGYLYLDGNKANNTAVASTEVFTDASTTNASATLTSVSASFSTADIGKSISGAGIPAGATIQAVGTGNQITLSAPATATAANVSITITGRTLTCAQFSAINHDKSLDFHLEKIYCFNAAGHSVDIHAGECTLDRVYPESHLGAGVHVWGQSVNCKFEGVVTAPLGAYEGFLDESSTPVNISVQSGLNSYVDCEVLGSNTAAGVTFAYGVYGKQWIGGRVSGVGKEPFRLVGGIKGAMIGPTAVYDCGVTTNNTYDGVSYVQGVDGAWPGPTELDLSFASEHANKLRYLVNEVNAAAGPTLVRGIVQATAYATAAVNLLNPASKIRAAGYVNEASGAATVPSGSTSIVVTHGLSLTPSINKIHLTMQNNPTNTVKAPWVSSITATQFTINVGVDPGASGATVGWVVAA